MHSHREHGDAGEDASLDEIINRAAVVVPEQGPLPAFVHHNTLHHFEHLPFAEGVLEGARLLGSQPYQTEVAFGKHLQAGRILPRDIDAVLDLQPGDSSQVVFPGGPTEREFRAFRLRYALDLPKAEALEWLLHEEGQALSQCFALVPTERRAELERQARERLVDSASPLAEMLQRVWKTLEQLIPPPAATAPARTSPRPRDQLWATYGIDTDLATHALLIRFTSSFLDQGLAYWTMPGREQGMLAAFRGLYGQAGGPPDAVFHGLDVELRRQQAENWNADQTITWALEGLNVPKKHWQAVIQLTLQSLRGWAGMVRQFEIRPHWAPVSAPPATLKDYLAVHLLLDWVGARNVREHATPVVSEASRTKLHAPLAYEAFVLAQLSNFRLWELTDIDNAKSWLASVKVFDQLERRRLWHLAYERRYRIVVLDALHRHVHDPSPTPKRATYQAVFCIDDREESLRRHLEETFPDVQTFGFAGFFGVAMEYQGLHDVRSRALCPVVVTPKHLVREVALNSDAHEVHASKRASQGRREHAFAVGTRTLVRGGLLSAGLGLAALVPLIGRTLFPRATHRWLHDHVHAPTTRLAIERLPDAPMENGLYVGYTVQEMADVVGSSLKTLGIANNMSPIVLIVGHGSSSLNNPHKAAYDCGATGGGRGGPNARAFAAMANHPEVRAELEKRELLIPSDTYFVGGFHNTSDDSMVYYDLDLMPQSFVGQFSKLRQALDNACELDAHERCRRFVHAPLALTPYDALCHVEGRAADIGQPRPECGHATNAICIVGRRERTRGLFLDRRAFLVTYDPTSDPSEEILGNLMQAVGPVGAGINLEYYFSYIDPKNYGCGSKLPHNLVGLFGVMDGHASDLRTGLPWQMVEIHEPVRLLTIVEAKCDTLERLVEKRPSLAPLVLNEWILLVALDPDSSDLFVFEQGQFKLYIPENSDIPTFSTSVDAYRGNREHLACVRIAKPNIAETRI